MTPEEIAEKIRELQVQRAHLVYDNLEHLAPFGNRSAAVIKRELELLNNGIEGKNEAERKAALEIAKAGDEPYQTALVSHKVCTRQIALIDAEIEYLGRISKAATLIAVQAGGE